MQLRTMPSPEELNPPRHKPTWSERSGANVDGRDMEGHDYESYHRRPTTKVRCRAANLAFLNFDQNKHTEKGLEHDQESK